MSTRFPEAMHRLRARFPKAERIVQVRIFSPDGDILTMEGPCTLAEAGLIARVAFGKATRHEADTVAMTAAQRQSAERSEK